MANATQQGIAEGIIETLIRINGELDVIMELGDDYDKLLTPECRIKLLNSLYSRLIDYLKGNYIMPPSKYLDELNVQLDKVILSGSFGDAIPTYRNTADNKYDIVRLIKSCIDFEILIVWVSNISNGESAFAKANFQ